VQIVTNNGELQHYAAEQALCKLQAGSAHETIVKVAGYILGEYGQLLSVPCSEYFGLLLQRFPACGLETKALLLSAFAKARGFCAHTALKT
jgi:AP-2 complex subunit alpha